MKSQHPIRREICQVVRSIVPGRCFYWADKRKSEHKSNIFGNQMKWYFWEYKLREEYIDQINARIRNLGLEAVNKKSAYLQVFRIGDK